MQKQTLWNAPILLLMLLFSDAAMAARGELNDVRLMSSSDQTRLVFDISSPMRHKVFALHSPERVVIDLEDVTHALDPDKLDLSKGIIKGVRTASRGEGDLRIVLDLAKAAAPKGYLLRPKGNYGNRLVVELKHGKRSKAAPVVTRISKPTAPVKSADQYSGGARDVIIAVDAGHGGQDPGAIGPNKVLEKDITFGVAKRLKRLIDKQPGMRAILTRKGDYFIRLRERTGIARRNQADLFISIHADSFKNDKATGASVYTLSSRGASSEHARLLAKKENAADLVGGVKLGGKDDLLASVLLDLSQTASNEASTDVAGRVLKGLKRVGKLHKRDVEQAGFRVLKSPDIPSILVELAFISNPKEEQRLKRATHQQKMAQAILTGVKGYFTSNPPPGTKLAAVQRHTIARGQTLSEIASTKRVSKKSIKKTNNLRSSALRIGQVLTIPSGS